MVFVVFNVEYEFKRLVGWLIFERVSAMSLLAAPLAVDFRVSNHHALSEPYTEVERAFIFI